MSDKRPRWHFHKEPSGTIYGNDASLFHFQGQGDAGWVRELMQNSLDAQHDCEKPVEVHLRQETLRATDVDLEGLLDTIGRCLESKQTGKAEKMLAKARSGLRGARSVPSLHYEERNTRGARRSDGTWKALTRSEGVSHKGSTGVMGVYGIGKNAVYTASPIHAAVYVSRYGEQEHMIGRASLSSHHDKNGRLRQPRGLLGRNEGKDLERKEIPASLRRDGQGLSIHILGSEELERRKPDYLASTATHYFPAILLEKLVVTVDGEVLDTGSLFRHFPDNRREGAMARRGAEAMRNGPVAGTHIKGIGKVTLYARREEEGDKPLIFLARGAGLVIARTPTAMSSANPSPDHAKCVPYTAVLHVFDVNEPGRGYIRECENPAHDRIEPNNIPDETTRKEARKALRALAKWTKEEIEKFAERKLGEGGRNASELAYYLPSPNLFQDLESGEGRARGEEVSISTPKQAKSDTSSLSERTRAESKRKVAEPEGPEWIEDEPPEGANDPDNPDDPDDPEPRPDGPDVPEFPKPGATRAVYKCDRTRVLPRTSRSTGAIRIAFDLPGERDPEFELCIVADDGKDKRTPLYGVRLVKADSRQPVRGQAALTTKKESFRIEGVEPGKRVQVEIDLPRHARDKTYDLLWREPPEEAADAV